MPKIRWTPSEEDVIMDNLKKRFPQENCTEIAIDIIQRQMISGRTDGAIIRRTYYLKNIMGL